MRVAIYNNETGESQRVTKLLRAEIERAGLVYDGHHPEVVITISLTKSALLVSIPVTWVFIPTGEISKLMT